MEIGLEGFGLVYIFAAVGVLPTATVALPEVVSERIFRNVLHMRKSTPRTDIFAAFSYRSSLIAHH